MFSGASDSVEYNKIAAQERLLIDVALSVWTRNRQRGQTLDDLATLMGSKKAHISRLLSGDANITLRTLSDLAFSLDCEASVALVPKWSNHQIIKTYKSESSKPLTKVRVSQIAYPYDGLRETKVA